MVDKSQQTDSTEKKKPVAVVQPPAPKATLSIGNISGSKGNHSAKEYESLRLSSQLQQTWIKRKHGLEMNDKSIQTDVPVEEKVIFIDKALTLEELPASVGETAPELPQSVPEVEILTSRPTTQLTDRSQQTSCIGDWSLLNICPKDKVDRGQQTYFSELEITIMSMPSSSPIESKEETIPVAQEDSSFEVNGCLEIEVSTEQILDAMMSFTEGEFSAEIQAIPADELPSVEAPGDISHLSVQGALSDEAYDQQNPQGAAVAPSELPTESLVALSKEAIVEVQNLETEAVLERPGKVEAATAEESIDGVQSPLSDEASKEIPVEVQSPLDEQAIEAVSAKIILILAEEIPIEEVFERGPPPTEDAPAEVSPADGPPQPAEDAPAEDIPAIGPPPPAEDAPAEDIPADGPPSTEDAPAEDSPAIGPPPTEDAPAEEIPADGPPLTEDAPAEEIPADGPPPTEDAPAEDSPAIGSPPPTEEAPAEDSPAIGPPPPAEDAPAEDSPADGPPRTEEAPAEDSPAIGPPPTEDAPAEDSPAIGPPPPTEDAPAEDSPAIGPPPPTEDAPAEDSPVIGPPPPTEDTPAEDSPAIGPPPPNEEAPAEDSPAIGPTPTEDTPAEDSPADGPPPPTEECPTEVPPPPNDEVPTEVQFPQTEETSLEETPVGVQSLPAEELFTKVVPVEEDPAAEIGFPSTEEDATEETTMEAQLTSVEESPEKASAEVQLPAPETPADVSPVVKQPSKNDTVPVQELPTQETPAKAPLLPSEQPSEDKAQLKEQLSPLASFSLTGNRISEGTDPIPADESRSKDEPISTFKIE
ncbi:hypothetical protein STEG23_011199, partial [Scotinomys teguina]